MEQRLSFGQIVTATFALVLGDLPVALLTIVAIAAVAMIVDVTAPSAGNILNIPVLVVQYYLIRRLIERQGLRSADRLGGFGSFFVVGLVTGLAILLGFVLLILPGIYLSARWSLADAAVVAENRGFSDAIKRSWDATAGNVLPIVLASLAISIPLIVYMALMFATGLAAAQGDAPEVTSLGFGIVANLLLFTSQVCLWYFGVALYRLLLGGSDEAQLGEVFA